VARSHGLISPEIGLTAPNAGDPPLVWWCGRRPHRHLAL